MLRYIILVWVKFQLQKKDLKQKPRARLQVTARIALAYSGFADRCLTAWLRDL